AGRGAQLLGGGLLRGGRGADGAAADAGGGRSGLHALPLLPGPVGALLLQAAGDPHALGAAAQPAQRGAVRFGVGPPGGAAGGGRGVGLLGRSVRGRGGGVDRGAGVPLLGCGGGHHLLGAPAGLAVGAGRLLRLLGGRAVGRVAHAEQPFLALPARGGQRFAPGALGVLGALAEQRLGDLGPLRLLLRGRRPRRGAVQAEAEVVEHPGADAAAVLGGAAALRAGPGGARPDGGLGALLG